MGYHAIVRIYLKNNFKKVAFEMECHKRATIDKFLNDLNTCVVVTLGPITFAVSEFHHCEVLEDEEV